MIPILFNGTETEFTSNGVCRLIDCVSCTVTEERNGIFECEFEYPVTGRHYDLIQEGMIIYATHDETGVPEPFDIYKRSVPLNGIVTFNASHISYRLRYNVLKPFTASSCEAAIAALSTNSITPCAFTFTCTKSVPGKFSVTKPVSIKQILVGEQGSILDVYGTGEYTFNHWNVSLAVNRGVSTNTEIRYGKNLVELKDERNASGVYNAVVPFWASLDSGEVVTLPEHILYAADYQQTDEPLPIVLDLTDRFEETPTESELRTLAQSILDNADDREPYQTIDIDFVNLKDTLDYADVAPLQRVNLCDTIAVYYPGISAPFRKKVTKTVYNVLLDKYNSLTLGSSTISLVDVVRQATEREIDAPSAISINNLINNVTSAITGNQGGYVTIIYNADGQPEELLILCDTDDYRTATKLWRWNAGGLGYSSTGYNGTYTTAITADGHIVGSVVQTGIIKASTGLSYWDLESGEFYSAAANKTVRIADGNIYIGRYGTFFDTVSGVLSMGYYANNGTTYYGFVNTIQNGDYLSIGYINDSTGSNIMLASFAKTRNVFPSGSLITFYSTAAILNGGLLIQYSTEAGTTVYSALYQGLGKASSESEKYYTRLVTDPRYANAFVVGMGTLASTGQVSGITRYITFNYGENYDDHPQYVLVHGTMYCYSNVSCTSVIQRSDDRLKNYSEWDERYDLLFDALEPRIYHWKDDKSDKQAHIGLSAQSVHEALDVLGIEDSIVSSDGKHLQIDYTSVSMLALRKIKQQQAQIEKLEARLEKAEAMIEKLMQMMEGTK